MYLNQVASVHMTYVCEWFKGHVHMHADWNWHTEKLPVVDAHIMVPVGIKPGSSSSGEVLWTISFPRLQLPEFFLCIKKTFKLWANGLKAQISD